MEIKQWFNSNWGEIKAFTLSMGFGLVLFGLIWIGMAAALILE